ncbi:sugar transferase [Salipiger mucosus]|uniref:Undecaprenyl-phosphate galactosephosphotransferase n=1 Tax=Salipiger mucosus DSM 16094 TaxID=1123237 RepID=S9S7V9_9RHOB|nr:sugar transferase [Salipiger mucosus]EPX82329.1 Undecaprenyl-phosphate galactosephosphotransferase [Salipiger mucosus DSM 16094]
MQFRPTVQTTDIKPLFETAARAPREAFYHAVAKRALDVCLVLLAALPALIVVSVLAVLVARDGHSPFYRQDRLGLNGRVFRLWKLRSMVPDAEARLEAHLAADPEARAEWDHAQKLRHDPRITPVGRFIRKSSLDELPQLWNVLRGDMALVGPRPMLVEQRAIYPGTAYYALRPGITGFWQTSVRNESSFSERAEFDADYLSRMSLATDLRVLLKTVRVVVRGTGC